MNLKEIAYCLNRSIRVIKVYDWYEIQERYVFNKNEFWDRKHRGSNLGAVLKKLEQFV